GPTESLVLTRRSILSQGTNQARRGSKRRCVTRELPLTHRGARVVGADALRISLILQETSDGEEHKQDSEDDPNINAHQSSLPVRCPPIYRETKKAPGAQIRQGADRVNAPTRPVVRRKAGRDLSFALCDSRRR